MDFKTSETGTRKSEVPKTPEVGSFRKSEVGSTGILLGRVEKLAEILECNLHAGLEQINTATHWQTLYITGIKLPLFHS